MADALFSNTYRGDPVASPTIIRASSSPLLILNNDSMTQTGDVDDPYAVAAGDDAQGAAIHIRSPGNHALLGLHNLVSGAGAITTALGISAFGFEPIPKGSSGTAYGGFQAADVDSTNYDDILINATTSMSDTDVRERGHWLPLYHPKTDVHLLDFTTVTEVTKDDVTGGAQVFRIQHDNIFLYCGGFTKVMVLIRTAMVGPTAGVLAGRFFG